jgi:hypothetical protein
MGLQSGPSLGLEGQDIMHMPRFHPDPKLAEVSYRGDGIGVKSIIWQQYECQRAFPLQAANRGSSLLLQFEPWLLT